MVNRVANASAEMWEVWVIDAWYCESTGWQWNDRSRVGTVKVPAVIEETCYGYGINKVFRDYLTGIFNVTSPIEFAWYQEFECECYEDDDLGRPLYQFVKANQLTA